MAVSLDEQAAEPTAANIAIQAPRPTIDRE
jgi:hypothetical protein